MSTVLCLPNEKSYFDIVVNQNDDWFQQIATYDIDHVLLNQNCFQWYSEATGIIEESHHLAITQSSDVFTIQFYQNPNHPFRRKDLCAVCFCLSGSAHPMVANAFSMMQHQLIESMPKVKILK